MSVPGPSGTVLVLGLLGLAAASTVLGEGVRLLAVRWVGSWRDLELVERGLLDFFLGGAALYLLAALPIGGFSLPTVVAVFLAGGAGVGYALLRAVGSHRRVLRPTIARLLQPAVLLSLLSGLALLVFEVVVAVPVGTGNTYDSSLLTFYTARLLAGHQLSFTFLPSASLGILYPQATTAYLGTAQLLLGLPGARTSLLLTPLFFGLAPIGGFVLGRRLFSGDLGGLAVALLLTLTASWSRVLVGGSNDFVFAFPLVLWLAGQSIGWMRTIPTQADALGFGLVLGYSAALNPMGAEWLVPALVLAALFVGPRFAGSARRWLARWGMAVLAALVPLVPTWYVVARGLASPGFVSGAGARPGVSEGTEFSRFVGWVDPYLFRPSDVWLSPVPFLRAELAILLTIGLALLLFVGRATLGPRFGAVRAFLAAGLLATWGLLVLSWVGSTGGNWAILVSLVSSSEASIWLFTFYTLLAALPLVLVLEWAVRANRRPEVVPPEPARTPLHRAVRLRETALAVLPVVLALLIILPGAALTPTQLPPVLSTLYHDFGNVTPAEFALLEYAGSHLPTGARVLVAPGSAGEFLPAYDPSAVLLYPMLPGWNEFNASYALVVSELTNATLEPGGHAALRILNVQYVIVTPASTVLWPAFSPAPLPSAFGILIYVNEGSSLWEIPQPAPSGPPGPVY
ncbi:MAG: hypothetical protein L3J92_01845 [Thermoplasmata archaeon]|nr:hypothetical protein [Thermoplasmata archaeon]